MIDIDSTDSVNFRIRLADGSDAGALAKLRYLFRSTTGTASEDEQAFVERCTAWMADRLREETSWRCWVAEQERSLIGAVWLKLIEKIPNPTAEPEQHAYVTNFYVAEGERGKGIGARLLATALDWCRDASVHAVILWPTEQSRSLYERYGFAVPADLLELLIADVSTEH
jgi:GNAT superfamily N-acetyltransferase